MNKFTFSYSARVPCYQIVFYELHRTCLNAIIMTNFPKYFV